MPKPINMNYHWNLHFSLFQTMLNYIPTNWISVSLYMQWHQNHKLSVILSNLKEASKFSIKQFQAPQIRIEHKPHQFKSRKQKRKQIWRERENGPECRESKERAARPSRIGRRRRWCNWEQESPSYSSVSLREAAETKTEAEEEEEEKKKNWDRSGGLGSRCRRRRLQPFPLPPHPPSGSCTETGSTLTRSSPPWTRTLTRLRWVTTASHSRYFRYWEF